jgi:hypothetical protein
MHIARFVIVFFVLLSSAVSAHCESQAAGMRELYQVTVSKLFSRTLWLVPEAKFQDTCFWDTRNLKQPPLSVTAAITAARSFLSSRREPDELPLWSVQLRRPHNATASESLYFYVVTFDDSGQAKLDKKFVTVVVLLDGSVIAPLGSKP